MKLTKRELNRLIENYLIAEGRRDRDWIDSLNIPEEDKEEYRQAESQGLKIPELSWIEKVRGTEPIRDVVPDVLEFKKPDFINKMKTKAKRLNDPSLLKQLNLSVKIYPTVNSLRAVLEKINIDTAGLDTKTFVPIETGDDLEIVGEVGPWTIILPKTIRGSVSCDPFTSKDTTWCTTKRSGQNLFYSYVGEGKVNMMLFYIMDYNRSPDDPYAEQDEPFQDDNDSRISLGVIDSEPAMDGSSGGISVDASNTGYFDDDLENVLDSHYEPIMNLIRDKIREHGGISPALKTVKNAASNLDLLLKITKDYEEDSKAGFIVKAVHQENVSLDVLNYFYNFDDPEVREAIAGNPKTPPETLIKMSEFETHYMGTPRSLTRNPSSPVKVLTNMYEKALSGQQGWLKSSVFSGLAQNPLTPTKIINDIAATATKASSDPALKFNLASNSNLPVELIEKYSNDKDSRIRAFLARNPATPSELVEKLALDEDSRVRVYAILNPKISRETLEKLINDKDVDVRANAAYLIRDPEILEKISNDPKDFVRSKVAHNKATSIETLKKLSNDSDDLVRKAAKANLAKKQTNERKRYSLKFLF